MESKVGGLQGRHYTLQALTVSEESDIAVCLESIVHILSPQLTGISSDGDTFTHAQIDITLMAESEDFGESHLLDKPLEQYYVNTEMCRSCAWSPTFLSKALGCILTVITTKHRVLHFARGSDARSGHWELQSDLTMAMKSFALGTASGVFDNLQQINRFHTTFAAWSTRLTLDPLEYNPAALALGNKAGQVILLMYSPLSYEFLPISTIESHTSAISYIQWTKWRRTDDSQFFAYLVSGSVDGKVVLTKVQFDADLSLMSCHTTPLYTWFEEQCTRPSLVDIWENENNLKIMVVKQVFVYHITLSVASNTDISVNRDWITNLIPRTMVGAVGGTWLNDGQHTRLVTHEGDGLVYYDHGESVELMDSASVQLTKNIRRKFAQQWHDELDSYEDEELRLLLDMAAVVFGAGSYGSHLYTPILYKISPVSDVHAVYESKDVLTVSCISHPETQPVDPSSMSLDRLTSAIQNPYFLYTQSLRGMIIEHLKLLLDQEKLDHFSQWLQQLNNISSAPDDIETFAPEDLRQRVFCTGKSIANQITLSTCRILQKFELDMTYKQRLHDMDQNAKHFAIARYLHTVLASVKHLDEAAWTALSEDDLLQVTLWCHRVILEPFCPQELLLLVETVCQRLAERTPVATEMKKIKAGLLAQDTPSLCLPAKLACPACQQPVVLSAGDTVCCHTGHVWPICQLTLRIIASPFHQRCTQCEARYLNRPNELASPSLQGQVLTLFQKCWNCAADILPTKF
ncbi:hypothetical protein DM01DRAFT_3087 [Hesseltinella vesiculosa]|uniref:Transcription factor IIIC putative zinc-finger domain-containing protein n=1 Tax=Hesseltinella vesiculosa TaxID=101127 RepID=A0A1X2GQA7_9FUNG|nr:hypothetical protein DM01DRAFT_3087 [Hesseltinella vesiculosa]